MNMKIKISMTIRPTIKILDIIYKHNLYIIYKRDKYKV